MFGLKDHHLFKMIKVYHWYPYQLTWTIHKNDKCEKDGKMAKLDGVFKEKT